MSGKRQIRRQEVPVSLRRATQIEALARWNADPARARWTVGLAQHLYSGPLKLGCLHYLSAADRETAGAAAKEQRKVRRAEAKATVLLRRMGQLAGQAIDLLRDTTPAPSAVLGDPWGERPILSGIALETLRGLEDGLSRIAKWELVGP
jgi:hypothetical protein